MTVTLPADTGSRRYVGPADLKPAGTQVGATEFAVTHVLLVDASNNPLLVEARIGATNETAPVSDTATAGLNGRLQRIAQRLTSLIGLLPTALGTGGGLKVDGSGTALPVSLASVPSHAITSVPLPSGGTPTAGTTSLTTTTASQIAASQACKSLMLQNDPDNSVDMLVGDASSQTIQLRPGDAVTLPVSNANLVYAKNVSSTTQSINWLAVS